MSKVALQKVAQSRCAVLTDGLLTSGFNSKLQTAQHQAPAKMPGQPNSLWCLQPEDPVMHHDALPPPAPNNASLSPTANRPPAPEAAMSGSAVIIFIMFWLFWGFLWGLFIGWLVWGL